MIAVEHDVSMVVSMVKERIQQGRLSGVQL